MIRTAVIVCLLGSVAGTPWSEYLANLAGKTSSAFDWQTACKKLGQSPAGYSMSMGGGTTTYKLTCNSNKIDVVCHGNPFSSCTSSYKEPAGAAAAAAAGPTEKVNPTPTCPGVGDEFYQKEIDAMVKLTNQMRCITGAPALKWDHALMCQAQKGTDTIGGTKMEHTKSYKLPIPAGENLASGHDVAKAAYMWFTEYLQQGTGKGKARLTECGHYSAMSWKANTKMGCGILRSGSMKGFVRCQFTGPVLPNMAGSYEKEVGLWDGNAAKIKSCGLDVEALKSYATMFKKYGILKPKAPYTAGIGLYAIETDIKETDIAPKIETGMRQHFTPMFFAALAVTGVALVALGVVVGRKTRTPYVAAADAESRQDSLE